MNARYSPNELACALGLFPPTEEQSAVIAAPPGPLVVIAGAGAGKTELADGGDDEAADVGRSVHVEQPTPELKSFQITRPGGVRAAFTESKLTC